MLSEDVQDDGFPVDHVDPQHLLEVALLAGCELVIEHRHIDVEGLDEAGQFLRFPLPDQHGGVELDPALELDLDRIGAGRVDQQRQLLEAGLGRRHVTFLGQDPHQQGALAYDLEVGDRRSQAAS